MFDGRIEYSLKRAQFLTEWAYLEGTLNYAKFSHDIDSIINTLNNFIDINNFRKYQTAPNFAVFNYFTKASIMNGNKAFTYDFEDPMGRNDFSKQFVTKLLRTHTGQCYSLPILYKILCDGLGGHSALALAPKHLYIKHLGEDGKWYNVELTHGGFVRDSWMIETMEINADAIRNGIFLAPLSEKENIALILTFLAKAYQQKYNSWDYFINKCCDKILKVLPTFSDTLVLKFILLQEQGYAYQAKYGNLNTPFSEKSYNDFIYVKNKLDYLGYSQISQTKYLENLKKAYEQNK